jgi:hypothetical protein
MASLLDQPQLGPQMGARGRQTVNENFDAMRNASRLLQQMMAA